MTIQETELFFMHLKKSLFWTYSDPELYIIMESPHRLGRSNHYVEDISIKLVFNNTC